MYPPQIAAPTSHLPPFCTCSHFHYHPVLGGAGFTLPGVIMLERAEGEGQAWPPGTVREVLASRPPLSSAHLETVLLASCPSGLHRYLIRPRPCPSPPPLQQCGPRNLVPNDYVQIGDDGCCCCCFCCFRERCDAVCPRGQPPPSPSLGISPESCQDHICPRPVGPPAPPLPSPSSLGDACACAHAHKHTHTHLTSHACFTF